MTSSLISDIPLAKYYLHRKQQQWQQQQQQQWPQHKPPVKHRGTDASKSSHGIKQKYPQHLLAYSIITLLVYLCWLPDFIVALKDVSVTIPQAVKRGSNAMLTCNYDMENDTLYSVKWYKGRREFYRYTPKENPAMKVFPSQSGLNVERNLSNQSHVVLLAVPLNISGKFTCEISVEAPSFQTAMVSGEMEVVELPEEQATVTGIQPRYRIGDLVDGNCSIKYSKPAANLTWTINGIVVPPHHIKTYQIEKYEETNLESVMSAIHFMVTTQHFIKGQMRLKCTASIFDIFKEEIESIIEEDRPRIMASGQSYPPEHSYGGQNDGDGYEHNESYLTYFSAPKSSASRTAEFIVWKMLKHFKQKLFKCFNCLSTLWHIKQHTIKETTFAENINEINKIKISSASYQLIQVMLIKYIAIVMVILLLLMTELFRKFLRKKFQMKLMVMLMTAENQVAAYNCTNRLKQKKFQILKWLALALQQENVISYDDDDCQAKCEQQKQQQLKKYCLAAANQNVNNEKLLPKATNITEIRKNKNKNENEKKTTIDCQHQMSQTHAVLHTKSLIYTTLVPGSSSLSASASSSSSLSSTTLSCDSFPLHTVDASKSNNAKYMSKDQALLMTFAVTATITPTCVHIASALLTSKSSCATPLTITLPCICTTLLSSLSVEALVLESKLLQTSVVVSPQKVSFSPFSPCLSYPLMLSFVRNNYLMAFIGELLLHQC